jgi:hypothetical protein
LVDIAGNFPFCATFSVTTHEAAALGAFSFVPTMEQGPDSPHFFAPVDIDETSHDKEVFDPLFTTDFFTVKPGRAADRSVVAFPVPYIFVPTTDTMY